jgi:hypothetical protein
MEARGSGAVEGFGYVGAARGAALVIGGGERAGGVAWVSGGMGIAGEGG